MSYLKYAFATVVLAIIFAYQDIVDSMEVL
jgi:hypothetical protein